MGTEVGRGQSGAVLRGGPGRAAAPQWKMCPQCSPHFGPASLDFHLNRPVISLIHLHIVAPPAGIVVPPLAPHLASARTAPGANLNNNMKLADLENPFGCKNLGHISYTGRVIANFVCKKHPNLCYGHILLTAVLPYCKSRPLTSLMYIANEHQRYMLLF